MRIAVILSALLHMSIFALSMLEASEIEEEEIVRTVAVEIEMMQLDEELQPPTPPARSEEESRPPPAPAASRQEEPMKIPEPEPLPPETPPPPPVQEPEPTPVEDVEPPPPAPEAAPPTPVQEILPDDPPEQAVAKEKEPEPVVEAPKETVSPPPPPRKPAPKLETRPKPSGKTVKQVPRLAKKPQVSSASFTESLLRNLDDAPTPEKEKGDQSELSSAEQERLVARLGDVIQSQIKPCWNIPAGAKDAANMKVAIHIRLNPDGSLNGQPRIVDTSRMQQDSFFKAVAESALRALRNPDCVPFRLPFDKYEIWRQISTLVFNPRHGLGGS